MPVLGKTQALGKVICATHADEVITFVGPLAERGARHRGAGRGRGRVEIKLYPDAFQLITNNEVSIGDVSGCR
ncbi:MAG: hypothetical protein U0Z44_01165 [Kouleothrix sp.]